MLGPVAVNLDAWILIGGIFRISYMSQTYAAWRYEGLSLTFDHENSLIELHWDEFSELTAKSDNLVPLFNFDPQAKI